MGRFVETTDRNQATRLPECLEDFISGDNLVSFAPTTLADSPTLYAPEPSRMPWSRLARFPFYLEALSLIQGCISSSLSMLNP